jgi:hypothetical protein
MPAERFIDALADWTVEKRADGWHFTRSANRRARRDWRGPYRSEATVALMTARELRKEINERYRRQTRGGRHERRQNPRAQ